MDAIYYRNPIDQFHADCISRELIKAYTCFRLPTEFKQNMFGVATGNWGCGAFNGNRELKGRQTYLHQKGFSHISISNHPINGRFTSWSSSRLCHVA